MLAIPRQGHRADNVIYLADVRKRMDRNDGSSDPPTGAGAARSYALNFLRAVAAVEADQYYAA
jgi:hypothetical protein